MGRNEKREVFSAEDLELFIAGVRYRLGDTPQWGRVEEVLNAVVAVGSGPNTLVRASNLARLNSLLRRYEWNVQVSPGKEGLRTHLTTRRQEGSALDRYEVGAVGSILDMMQHSQVLSKLSRCAVCGAFLVGKRNKPRVTCGPRCRQKVWYSVPDNRTAKQQTMRDNRKKARERDAKAKARIGYQSNRKT